LGSAEEVDPKSRPFADKRRAAGEQLMRGYAEMLAQELPDVAPELPQVGGPRDIVGEDANRRGEAIAQNLAQVNARREAEFIRDLVFRRDTLEKQLRWLYQPNEKVHGRKDEGMEELKALASKHLLDDKAVARLVERIMKKER
jgi:hypothetical protein